MRKKILHLLSKSVALGIALLLIALSIFAVQFGIDNDAGWGKGRILLLFIGIIFFLLFILIQFPNLRNKFFISCKTFAQTIESSRIKNFLLAKQRWAKNKCESVPFVSRIIKSPDGLRILFAVSGITLTLLTFLIHQHNRLEPINPTNYFDQLADGFLSGQASLLTKPPAELIALSDPYTYANREEIPIIWDVSYYQGEYYLYWGMVPALILSIVKWCHPMSVFDHYLVWFFYLGIILLIAGVLTLLHKKLFPNQPSWIIMALTWTSGTALPMLWLTYRPSVYEVAITTSQFFLLLGCLAALKSLWEKKPLAWLILAGFSWGATVNSRATLAAPIIWLSLLLCYLLYRKYKLKHSIKYLLAFVIPALLWAVALAGYNYIRFGDILETGHRYQLGGPFFPNPYENVSSWRYIFPSLYTYLIRPFSIESSFPYISVPFVTEYMWPFFIKLPEHYYYPEPAAGILLCVPIIYLSFLPFLNLIRKFFDWVNEITPSLENPNQPFNSLILWMFGGSGLIAFSVLLLFYTTSMRYLVDITPMLIIFSALSFWNFQKNFTNHQHFQRVVSMLTGILLLASVGIGYLASL